MTHISDALVPVQGALAPADEPTVKVEVDETAVRKALYVLRTLKNSGIKMHYESDLEEMALVWAGDLSRFSTGILDDAIAEWVHSETDWPTLGEMEALCGQIAAENIRQSAAADAAARNPTGRWCDECGIQDEEHPVHGFIRGYNVKYVRVEDPPSTIVNWKDETVEVPNHHMRPCSLCLPESYELYMANHFSADHRSRGGCRECIDFMPGHTAKKKPAGRIG